MKVAPHANGQSVRFAASRLDGLPPIYLTRHPSKLGGGGGVFVSMHISDERLTMSTISYEPGFAIIFFATMVIAAAMGALTLHAATLPSASAAVIFAMMVMAGATPALHSGQLADIGYPGDDSDYFCSKPARCPDLEQTHFDLGAKRETPPFEAIHACKKYQANA